MNYSKDNIIETIFRLDNVDVWKVIYYGLRRFLIDAELCVKFAEECLVRLKNNDKLVFEMAALLEKEYDEVFTLIDKIVIEKDQQEIIYQQDRFYSKLWFYINVSTELRELNLIS